MKNKLKHIYIFSLLLLPFLISCDKDLENSNTALENFEMLWKTVDEKYCFFEYKKNDIKNWNEVYREYKPRVLASTSEYELFYVFADMLNELKDGHVNLVSPFDVSRYDIEGDHPNNFNINLLKKDHYLGKNYKKAGGLSYKMLEGNIGYIYYGSFSSGFSESNLDYILTYFENTDGIIIDIRNNGGGNVSYVEMLASRFTTQEVLTGYWLHKTGKGHTDFSRPQPIYLSPTEYISYHKNVAVLTNRSCYSAANDFVQTMRVIPQVRVFGDRTGGGAGMPMSSELPCGWKLRLSVSPYMDPDMNYTEFGIDPDRKVNMNPEDELNGIDTIIETAREWLMNQ
jgi:hypothetical protein